MCGHLQTMLPCEDSVGELTFHWKAIGNTVRAAGVRRDSAIVT